jgi:hypothetical protein
MRETVREALNNTFSFEKSVPFFVTTIDTPPVPLVRKELSP